MSLCHDFFLGVSTLAWWGAWLNSYNDKTIIAPKEGMSRPGSGWSCADHYCEDWVAIKALNGMWDHNRVASIRIKISILIRKIKRMLLHKAGIAKQIKERQ